jgi:predicted transcriptional regulator
MPKAKEQPTLIIKNPNNDFAMVQNYVIQLVSEGKLTPSAFLLYTFYQSLSGFITIKVGYRYIKENTGISVGNISKCNTMLEKYGLIKKVNNGWKRTFTIELTPNHIIPRRTLKTVQDEQPCSNDENCSPDEKAVHDMNTKSPPCSSDELIYRLQPDILNTKNTTTAVVKNPKKIHELDTNKSIEKPVVTYNPDEALFLDTFMTKWQEHFESKYYTKGDYEAVKQLQDPVDALKYIEVLWCLDEVDPWVKNSDHSITIFVKEYKSGRLQSMYPKTIYSKKTMPA